MNKFRNTPKGCYSVAVIVLACKETLLYMLLLCNIISVCFYCVIMEGRIKSRVVGVELPRVLYLDSCYILDPSGDTKAVEE